MLQPQKKKVTKPLITIPYTGDIAPFPTAQGSSSVTDAPKDDVILNAKKRKLLDGEDDDDKVDDDTDKDEDDNHKDMDEDDKDENDKDKDEDDTDTAAKEATKITTPSKSKQLQHVPALGVVQLDFCIGYKSPTSKSPLSAKSPMSADGDVKYPGLNEDDRM
jgi:hypothetical protein